MRPSAKIKRCTPKLSWTWPWPRAMLDWPWPITGFDSLRTEMESIRQALAALGCVFSTAELRTVCRNPGNLFVSLVFAFERHTNRLRPCRCARVPLSLNVLELKAELARLWFLPPSNASPSTTAPGPYCSRWSECLRASQCNHAPNSCSLAMQGESHRMTIKNRTPGCTA